MYKKTTLDNGLRIITHRMPHMQSVALGIWIKVGGRYESKKNKGIAHFFEHLAFKGTRKYSCRKIKESIEGVGGSLNGFTSEEMTCYLVKLPGRYLDLGLDVLSDMAINATLPQKEVIKEKTVILEEVKMYKDQPQSYVYELLDELLWPDQPLGMAVIGTAESISGIGRKDLSLFKGRYYTAANMVVSAAGLLENDKFIKKVENIFAHLKNTRLNSFPQAEEKQRQPRLNLFHKDTEQTHLALGFHCLKRDHRLKHALGMMHIILGANMSSRLFNELREKRGLAYEIGTHAKRFADTGAFLVHAGIDNRKAAEAIKLILSELGKIKYKLVSADEFRRAKDFYLGQLALALEDTLDHMFWIGESIVTLDKTYSLADIVEEVNRVNPSDIREVASLVFKEEKLNLALIGPLKDKKQGIYKQLHLN